MEVKGGERRGVEWSGEERSGAEQGKVRSREQISYHDDTSHHISSYNDMVSHLPDPAPPHDTNFWPIKPSTGWSHSKSKNTKSKKSKRKNRKVV